MSIINHTVDSFCHHYVEVRQLKEGRVGLTCAAVGFGLLITIVALLAIEYHALSINPDYTCNMVIVGLGGSAVTTAAAIAVWRHYSVKIAKHAPGGSPEALIDALKNSLEEAAVNRFEHTLQENFSNEEWQQIMKDLDRNRNLQTEEVMKQVYRNHRKANPLRFIGNYHILKEKGELSKETLTLLEHDLSNYLHEESDALLSQLLADDLTCQYVLLNTLATKKNVRLEGLININSWGILFNYCVLKEREKVSTSDSAAIEHHLRAKLAKADFKLWRKILLDIEATFFNEEVPNPSQIKFLLLELLAELAPEAFAREYVRNFKSFGNTFRIQALESTPNPERTLNKMDYKQWHHLLAAADTTYFVHNAKKIGSFPLLEKMYTVDSAKFLEAYFFYRNDFSKPFNTWIYENIGTLPYVDISFPLICMYVRAQPNLPQKTQEILEPRILTAIDRLPDWGKIIRNYGKNKTSKALLKAMCAVDRERFTKAYGYFDYMEAYATVKSQMTTQAQVEVDRIIEKQLASEIRTRFPKGQ